MQQLGRSARVAVLGGAALVLAVLHLAVRTDSHPLHIVHLALGWLSLLPILAGAIWFGLRGGIYTALLVSALYFVHMRFSWPNQPMENANQMTMIAVYLFVGTASGILVMLQDRERQRRITVEQNAQREAIAQGLTSLATALGSRDGYTLQHSRNVARLAVELGMRRGLPPERLELLRLAALVHDIGKIGVRDEVLLKPDRFTSDEAEEMHRHPDIAADILRGIRGTEEIAAIVLAHHERLDGTGYPLGLRGDQIPLEAQILSVADIFCALTEQRAYKPTGVDAARAMQMIEPLAHKELDGVTVQLLKEMLPAIDSRPKVTTVARITARSDLLDGG
jgi:putative nucleotidyltransferase with HDIG domain